MNFIINLYLLYRCFEIADRVARCFEFADHGTGSGTIHVYSNEKLLTIVILYEHGLNDW